MENPHSPYMVTVIFSWHTILLDDFSGIDSRYIMIMRIIGADKTIREKGGIK
jgi:hypothetical protein